ncbi:hypothetical protein ACTXT7_010903 [Hymenolepis weldensis]
MAMGRNDELLKLAITYASILLSPSSGILHINLQKNPSFPYIYLNSKNVGDIIRTQQHSSRSQYHHFLTQISYVLRAFESLPAGYVSIIYDNSSTFVSEHNLEFNVYKTGTGVKTGEYLYAALSRSFGANKPMLNSNLQTSR